MFRIFTKKGRLYPCRKSNNRVFFRNFYKISIINSVIYIQTKDYFLKLFRKMTLTRIANIYSEQNKSYRQTLEEIYPLVFSPMDGNHKSPSVLLKSNCLNLISEFKDIDSLFENSDEMIQKYGKDASKKYKLLLKLECFCQFTTFFLQNFSKWKILKCKKLLKAIQEKLEKFLSYMHKYKLDSLSTVEKARFSYIQGKFTIAKKMICNYLLTQEATKTLAIVVSLQCK